MQYIYALSFGMLFCSMREQVEPESVRSLVERLGRMLETWTRYSGARMTKNGLVLHVARKKVGRVLEDWAVLNLNSAVAADGV